MFFELCARVNLIQIPDTKLFNSLTLFETFSTFHSSVVLSDILQFKAFFCHTEY